MCKRRLNASMLYVDEVPQEQAFRMGAVSTHYHHRHPKVYEYSSGPLSSARISLVCTIASLWRTGIWISEELLFAPRQSQFSAASLCQNCEESFPQKPTSPLAYTLHVSIQKEWRMCLQTEGKLGYIYQHCRQRKCPLVFRIIPMPDTTPSFCQLEELAKIPTIFI